MRLSIRGIQEAQKANEQIIALLRPNSAFGRAVQYATIQAHRYVVAITHVDSGALRASHRMEVKGLQGRIFIDPTSPGINRRRGRRSSRVALRPAVYGPMEHARGGSHAFYQRTEREAGVRISRAAAIGFLAELPR